MNRCPGRSFALIVPRFATQHAELVALVTGRPNGNIALEGEVLLDDETQLAEALKVLVAPSSDKPSRDSIVTRGSFHCATCRMTASHSIRDRTDPFGPPCREKDLFAEQVEIGSAIHLPLDHSYAIDVASTGL